MKQLLGTLIGSFFLLVAHGQYTIKGHVVSDAARQPVEAATVIIAKRWSNHFGAIDQRQWLVFI